jgi:threonine synthase
MMTTPTEENVRSIEIDGDFDDCQALVKAMFNHQAFRDRVRLSGINSINWGRIVAQATYYFVAAVALGAPHRRIAFSVPTGNFGDIFAGYVAGRMGLPIERLVIATNDNDILARARETGAYEMRSVAATTSPSMDIQISSNFERWLFEASGRDAGLIRGQMAALAQGRRFDLSPRQWDGMKATLGADRADEARVADTIRRVAAGSGYAVEPHTACGVAALESQTLPAGAPRVVLATAHPAKFPDAMEAITGERPTLPARLARLMTDPERFTSLPNDLSAVERFIETLAARRAGEAA